LPPKHDSLSQDVFVTMMDTGCRPGEVLALRWEDILWDLGVTFVR
jgi:integrase